MFNAFVITIFILLIAWLEYFHFKERKQLYSRIQARDLSEYKRIEEPVKKEKEEKKPIHFV